MKTITEFFVADLLNTLKMVEELSKAGKTPEEITQAVGEATKREGDKLKFFMNAVESIRKRAQGLKRVVVLQAGETDKVPEHAEKRDEYVYLPEYYPAMPDEKRGRGRPGDQRRDKKGRDKKGRKGGRGERKFKPRESGQPQIAQIGGFRGPKPVSGSTPQPRSSSVPRPKIGRGPVPVSTVIIRSAGDSSPRPIKRIQPVQPKPVTQTVSGSAEGSTESGSDSTA